MLAVAELDAIPPVLVSAGWEPSVATAMPLPVRTSLPPLIVVAPLYVFGVDKNSVPVPFFVRLMFPARKPLVPLVTVLILKSCPELFVTVSDAGCSVIVAGIVNVLFAGVDGESVMMTLSRLKNVSLAVVVLPLFDQFPVVPVFHVVLLPTQVKVFALPGTFTWRLFPETLTVGSPIRDVRYRSWVAVDKVGTLEFGIGDVDVITV